MAQGQKRTIFKKHDKHEKTLNDQILQRDDFVSKDGNVHGTQNNPRHRTHFREFFRLSAPLFVPLAGWCPQGALQGDAQ